MAGRRGAQGRRARSQDRRRCHADRPEGRHQERDRLFDPGCRPWSKCPDEAEMIVVGSSGRGMLARGLLGSVSSSVVRHANCPVAVIRDEDPLMPDPQHAPVLLGIDGSPASELATAIAFDEASRRGVDLMAVHAWSDVLMFELPGLDWSALQAEAERSLAERLAGWQERYPDVTVHRVIVCDRPARPARRKVRIRTACRRRQSRPRWFEPHDAGLGQQRSRARRPNAGDRRPAVVSVSVDRREERWPSTRTGQRCRVRRA